MCWNDTLPPWGIGGEGVIVGIVSTGIDVAHEDFIDDNGNTRLLYVWDQTMGSDPGEPYGYGTEWDSTEINAGSCTEQDLSGMGTHVAGCAAANGRATGNGYPQYRYTGIAPEASIIAVKSAFLFESRIEDAVEYIFLKADTLGMKAVVCVLYGTRKGPHDGSYPLEENLSALTRAGRLIVVPVGDASDSSRHASMTTEGTTTFSIPTYTPSMSVSELIECEGWHDPSVSWNIRLTGPLGATTGWVTPGNSVNMTTTVDGGIYVENDVNSSSSGAKKIRVRAYEFVLPPTMGTWTIETDAVNDGRLDLWLTESIFSAIIGPTIFTSNVDSTQTILSPSTADSVIAVGAYTTKTTWTNFTGMTSFYVGAVLNEIYDESSVGPCRNGVIRPDVLAPGQGVMTSLSGDVLSPPSGFRDPDGVHRILRGSNQAAGVTTGVLALLLEMYPGLTPSGAREFLQDNAIADSFTGTVPNNEWGYGKIRLNCSTAVGVPLPISATSLRLSPNPGKATVVFSSVPGHVRIYDLSGRQVGIRYLRSTQNGQWASPIQNLRAGIYILQHQNGSTAKMTVVR